MIKRLILTLTMLSLALTLSLGMLTITADGASAAPTNVSQICSDFNDFGTTHGACVAYLTNGNATPYAADLCRSDFIQAYFGDNHGQCVVLLKAYFGR